MENEFGEAARRRQKAKLKLANEKITDTPVRFPQFDIDTTLVTPPVILELRIDAIPAGEGIRLAFVLQAPLYKIAPPDVIRQAGRDPMEVSEGCWEDLIIDRPWWRRVLDNMCLRSFNDVVMYHAIAFYKRTHKQVRGREFKLARSIKTMEWLQSSQKKD